MAMKRIRLALLVIALLPALGLAGANRDSEESGPSPDEGPSYSGVVLDAAGKPVADARISASHRGGPAMITRSSASGTFSLPGFNRKISPNEVDFSCAKPGYRQIGEVRRIARGGQASRVIELECRLQRS